MPMYEYTCSRCRRDFEELVRDAAVPPCPHCGSKQVERLMSAPAAHGTAVSSKCEGADFCPGIQSPCGGGCCAHTH